MQKYQTYCEYMESDHWQGIRLLSLRNAGYKCECCFRDGDLQGHHMRYGTPLNSCTPQDISILCATCHGEVHKMIGGAYSPLFDTREKMLPALRKFMGFYRRELVMPSPKSTSKKQPRRSCKTCVFRMDKGFCGKLNRHTKRATANSCEHYERKLTRKQKLRLALKRQ